MLNKGVCMKRLLLSRWLQPMSSSEAPEDPGHARFIIPPDGETSDGQELPALARNRERLKVLPPRSHKELDPALAGAA
jgi:hypothetical protein